MNNCARHYRQGFTLIEAVIVIAVTGIIAAMIAVFIKSPVQGYVNAARRAELTDAADTAVRRISRELRHALPNSVRISGNYLEFIPVKSGGRYRWDDGVIGAACAAGKPLSFNGVDNCFEVLGPAVTAVANTDFLVIYNLGQCANANCASACSVANPGADAYQGCNRTLITGNAANILSFTAIQFPFDSPSHRFHVINGAERAVTYGCVNAGVVSGDGQGTLTRYTSYGAGGFNAIQSTTGLGAGAVLARNVESCVFTYAAGQSEREGLLTISLKLTRGGESVSLYDEVHINNAP